MLIKSRDVVDIDQPSISGASPPPHHRIDPLRTDDSTILTRLSLDHSFHHPLPTTASHKPSDWLRKERRRLAKKSADIMNIKAKLSSSSPAPNALPSAGTHAEPHSDFSVPEALLKGTMLLKVSEKKQKQVIFHLDPDEGRILYKSSKTGVVSIETIKEIRSGTEARYYRAQFGFPEDAESRWITVIYILEGTYKTLHMVAPTRDIFNMWDTALRKLFAIRQGLLQGLGNVEMRRAVWERQYWKGADDGGDQKLGFGEVEQLCRRLNANLGREDLRKLFLAADTEKKGYLDFTGFQTFVKTLKRRPDIESLYQKLSTSDGSTFDFPAFEKFMRESQQSSATQDELHSIFAKYTTPQPALEGRSPSDTIMSLDDFTSFLVSADNAVFPEKERSIWQDMALPISDYYISSSHNTYLVGHQLVGVSTIEGYIRALLHSCRSVELDIYDGDDEPVIFHGKTLTSKVSLRDVCHAIAKYAFVTSPYPLLISAEVHCGLKQQDMMVEIMTEAFGEALVRAPVEGRPRIQVLPSPEDLKGKFLLKAKNLYVVAQLESLRLQKAATPASPEPTALEADASSSSSDDSDSASGIVKGGLNGLKEKWRRVRGKDSPSSSATSTAAASATSLITGSSTAASTAPRTRTPKPKVRMSFALASLLVYTVGVKCHGFSSDITYAPEHIFSLSESAANKLIKADASMRELVRHNQNHMVRIYPKGVRVSSSNYEPHRYWAAGAQVVAINWQTFDLGYMMNQAMFLRNGRAGYVLKPPALREGGEELLSKRTRHFLDITVISAQQLPRLRDSNGQEIVEKSIVDPFVQVFLHIPDWSNSPFLPPSSAATSTAAAYSPSTDATPTAPSSARTVSFSTHVIKNNGFNPVWWEALSLPFDCVGDMRDLIFVEFSVRQQGKDDEDDQPIAVYCTPLSCLEKGYRHLPLHDSQLTQYLFSTLFVKIGIRDIM
ncbi:1-phosphatidylinositol 4,5-bisphosphate phosphodiesterase 1 [Hypsizygus marmoreus]|uniref:Phosphoinositide phospholipase C n=1 Tax=Hypsizygus marmoreus TaxID=39966 RepID=A0A369J757_HYPMA|nr:1-phosphatidylinositol 4,5-bisphosphate phosphodiesterase 1 [Hypsizygus marmoreus]